MAIINRLRFVDVLSPQIGEQASREFTEALQDEMQDVVLSPEQELLLARLMADVRAEMADVRSEMADLRALVWQVAATVVAINLTAIGIATGLIIALN